MFVFDCIPFLRTTLKEPTCGFAWQLMRMRALLLDDFIFRSLKTELGKDENVDIPDDIKSEFIEFCHQSINSYDGSETWFNTSVSTFKEYKMCEGNPTIMWKKVGFKTLFDILMVIGRRILHYIQICFSVLFIHIHLHFYLYFVGTKSRIIER